ncbi:MAG: ribosomal L7Ae/L30e/S12e/Gadd45 family protein [Ignavibacteriales bacterium]
MPLETLRKAKRRTVGTKQTIKAVEKGTARRVFVARDADERVTEDILTQCRENAVEVEYVESMAVLGKACGIDVGAASAAVLYDEPEGGR